MRGNETRGDLDRRGWLRSAVVLGTGAALGRLSFAQAGQSNQAAPPVDQGVLVVSLGAKFARVALHVGFELRSLTQPDKTWTLSWSNQSNLFSGRGGIEMPAGELPEVSGLRLAVLHQVLPAGQYVIQRMITRPWKFVNEKADEMHKVFVPFEIAPGRATYAGEILGWMTAGTELPFGLVAPHALRLTLSDRMERDLRVLRSQLSTLGEEPPLRLAWLSDTVPDILQRVP